MKGIRRRTSRRRFLSAGMLLAAGFFPGLELALGTAAGEDGFSGGKLAGLLPFDDEEVAPAETLMGAELDGRLFTDLTKVPARRTTPNAAFFVRSAASKLLPSASGWKIEIDGRVERTPAIGIEQLRRTAKPMGIHLMECAGNVALTRFGLISAANWAGVPMGDVLSEAKRKAGAEWVEISGFDEYSAPSRTSVPGASWIFPVDALKNAFLATEMNGETLSADHGAPVRLVVPGWYGCACIKWVNRVAFVGEGVEASSQMREYAVRTLQEGRPELAKDFAPANADTAALPVRVEKWVVGGKIRYRIVGLVWGGSQPVKRLQIRVNPDRPYVPVPGFVQLKTDPWTVWSYDWVPAEPGTYRIRMAVSDPPVRARKLEMGLYDRTVHVNEV